MRIEALTGHMDFLSTSLSLLGVDCNVLFDGDDMWKLVASTEKKLRDYIVTGYSNFGSVHTQKWHYFQNVWGDNPGLGPQLYDIENDHAEEKNIVEKYPEVTYEMKKIPDSSFQES